MPHIAERHPNILFDSGVMLPVAHLTDLFVKKVGAHRLMLGTDFYSFPKLFNHPFPIYEFLGSDMTDEQCAAVLGGNARKLLSLP